MNKTRNLFIYLLFAHLQVFAHSQSLLYNLSEIFNFSLPGSGEEILESSGEFLGAPCDFGTKVIGPPGFNVERSSVNGFCAFGEVCGTFNSSVVVNVSGIGYPGILIVGSCFTPQRCRTVGCLEARSQSLDYVGLHLSSNFMHVDDVCSRSCCDASNTCTTSPVATTTIPTTTSSQHAERANTTFYNQTRRPDGSVAPISTTTTDVTETSFLNVLPCGFDGFLSGYPQTIQSPGFPGLYPANELCEWQLRASTQEYRIRIAFSFVSTEPVHDTIEILEELNQRSEIYSGESTPAPYFSLSDFVIVRFQSDRSIEGVGFHATVEEVPEEVATHFSTTTPEVTSPPREFPCRLGAEVVNSEGRSFDLYHVDGTCSHELLCSSFNSTVLFNQTGNVYEGILIVTTCLSPSFCPQVTCDGVRGLLLSDPAFRLQFLRVDGSCSRRCCDVNNTCTVIPSSIVTTTTRTTTSQPTTLPPLPPGYLPCGFNGTVSESPVTIVTPGWPVSYRNYESCGWELHSNTSGHVLEVVFQSFHTESTFDYLSIFEDYREVFRYSGDNIPTPFISSSSSIALRFVSDPNVQRQGIQLRIREIIKPTQAPTTTTETTPTQPLAIECGFNRTVGATLMEIISPGWPRAYSDNVLCEWRIQANTPGYRVELVFTDFNIEYAFDYVDVFEGERQAAIHTGRNVPSTFISNTSSLLIRFRTDNSLSFPGFRAVVREVSPESLTTSQPITTVLPPNVTFVVNGTEQPSGITPVSFNRTTLSPSIPCGSNISVTRDPVILRSPNYPDRYGVNEECVWVIHANTQGYRLIFELNSIEIEENYDFITGLEDNQVVFLYSGQTIPDPYVSLTSLLYVRFTSDSTIAKRGFEATVREQMPASPTVEPTQSSSQLTSTVSTIPSSLLCGYNASVTQTPLTIRSPNYPNVYQTNEICEWRFHANTSGYVLVLEFILMETEANYDFINGSENNQEVFRLSGSTLPEPYVSTTSSLHIQFASDSSISGRGFEATIREQMPTPTTEETLQTATLEISQTTGTIPETTATTRSTNFSVPTRGPEQATTRSTIATAQATTRTTEQIQTLTESATITMPISTPSEFLQSSTEIMREATTTHAISQSTSTTQATSPTTAARLVISQTSQPATANETLITTMRETIRPVIRQTTQSLAAPTTSEFTLPTTAEVVGTPSTAFVSPQLTTSTTESSTIEFLESTETSRPIPETTQAIAALNTMRSTTTQLPTSTSMPESTQDTASQSQTSLETLNSSTTLLTPAITRQPITTQTNLTTTPLASVPSTSTLLSTMEEHLSSITMLQSTQAVNPTAEIVESLITTETAQPLSITVQPLVTETVQSFTTETTQSSMTEETTQRSTTTETAQSIATEETTRFMQPSTTSQTTLSSTTEETTMIFTLVEATQSSTTTETTQHSTTTEATHSLRTAEITRPTTVPETTQSTNVAETSQSTTVAEVTQSTRVAATTHSTTLAEATRSSTTVQASTSENNQPLPNVTSTLRATLDTLLPSTSITPTTTEQRTTLSSAIMETEQPTTQTATQSTLSETTQTTSSTQGARIATTAQSTEGASQAATTQTIQTSTRTATPSTIRTTAVPTTTGQSTTSIPVFPDDERFLPSCTVSHAVNSIFRCQHIFASPNIYRGAVTCRNEINEAIKCVGNQLAQCRIGGLSNTLDSFNLPLFNSRTMLTLLHNLTLQTGNRINNEINAFCFHAGLNLPFPYPVTTQLEGCQPDTLQGLLRRAKLFYYHYTWARNRTEICRAFRLFKQWFFKASTSLCDFENLSNSPNYPSETARYLSSVVRVALRTLEKLEISSCQDSVDEFNLESVENMFGCGST